MKWIKDDGKLIGGADGYRFEIERKFSDTFVLSMMENGKVIRSTTHSTIRDAKAAANTYYYR